MTIKTIKKSKNHVVTVIENPSKKMMDRVKQYLDKNEKRRKEYIKNRHLYFSE